jgi:thioredoxin-related protein
MKLLFLSIAAFVCTACFSQDMTKFKLYKPEENAKQAIENAVKQAKKEGKNVLIQIGGNWCIWCARFNDFVSKDKSLDSLMNANYVVYHLNWSKENKNNEILQKYSFPQRFGFPVFLILDDKGNLLHTQNSWYLEDGAKSYNKEKVVSFFNDWAPAVFDPAKYKDQ